MNNSRTPSFYFGRVRSLFLDACRCSLATAAQIEIASQIWALMISLFLTALLLVKWIICTRSVSFSNHANQLFSHAFELRPKLGLIVAIRSNSNGKPTESRTAAHVDSPRCSLLNSSVKSRICRENARGRAIFRWKTITFVRRLARHLPIDNEGLLLSSIPLALEWADDELDNGRATEWIMSEEIDPSRMNRKSIISSFMFKSFRKKRHEKNVFMRYLSAHKWSFVTYWTSRHAEA